MNTGHESPLKRIEAQLTRLGWSRENNSITAQRRERWLLAGFKPTGFDDSWSHDDGRVVSNQQVLTTLPEG